MFTKLREEINYIIYLNVTRVLINTSFTAQMAKETNIVNNFIF